MALNQGRIYSVEEGTNAGGINRAEQVRRDDDTVKTPKVTLFDIDYAMLYEIGQNMRLQVPENGRMIDVPVMYADAETWSQIRGRGFMRDNKRKIMAPVIAIRRTSIANDDRINTLDLNQLNQRRRFYPYKNLANRYDRFGDQSNRKPINEFYYIDIPNYIRVSYDLIVHTTYMDQLNIITQAFVAQSGHLWGDQQTFRAVVDSINLSTSNDTGQDRLVSATVSLTVDGYLREEFEYHEPTVNKAFTLKTVHFMNEQEQLEIYTEVPTNTEEPQHISQQPIHDILTNKRRDIRYR